MQKVAVYDCKNVSQKLNRDTSLSIESKKRVQMERFRG